ncbi:MAG: hypothetical protein IPL79_18475 [Myxococcales bacterium]|nr:hypothetical protein [Myxococcales bacterium]
MSNKKTITWITTLVLLAGFGTTASAARNTGGASRIEASQGASKVRSARLVRVRHGKSAGKLTASPVRAKVATQRSKAAQAEAAAVDRRMLNAAPLASVAFTIVSAANELEFLAGAGLVATAISTVFWAGAKFLNFLDKRSDRAAARDKPSLVTP